jgi:hypothetical protein
VEAYAAAKLVASFRDVTLIVRANQLDFFIRSLAELGVLFVHECKLAGNDALQLVRELVGWAMTGTEVVASHGERMVVARANQLDFFPRTLAKLSILVVHDRKLAAHDALQLIHELGGRAIALEAKVIASHCELVVVARANQLYFLSIPLAELSVLDVHECKLTGNDALQLVHELVGRARSSTEMVASHGERMVVSHASERHHAALVLSDKHQFALHELIRLVVANLGVRFDWTLVALGFAFERH